MEKKLGGDMICMRPDSIVEARFKLTRRQNDIMDIVFANINDDDNLKYEIELKKYVDLYNLKDTSDSYSELKKAVKTFEGKGFYLRDEDGKKETWFSWFSSITYLNGEGRIIVELGQTLKQLLLEVKRATFYNIRYSLNFTSIYAKRLYYYLKLYEDTGFRIDNVEELKLKLSCPKSYKNFADFARFVLKPALEEINGSSDIFFEYETKKTGKKITHIKFKIKKNLYNVADIPVIKKGNTDIDYIVNLIGITDQEAKVIYKASEGNLKHIEEVYNYFKNKANREGIVPIMVSMVKPGIFIPPQTTYKKNTSHIEPKKIKFNNFEPRQNVDYESLEDALSPF